MSNCCYGIKHIITTRQLCIMLVNLQSTISGIQLNNRFVVFDEFSMMWKGKGPIKEKWPVDLVFTFSIQVFNPYNHEVIMNVSGHILVRRNINGYDVKNLCENLNNYLLPSTNLHVVRSIILYKETDHSTCYLMRNGIMFLRNDASESDIFEAINNHTIVELCQVDDTLLTL